MRLFRRFRKSVPSTSPTLQTVVVNRGKTENKTFSFCP